MINLNDLIQTLWLTSTMLFITQWTWKYFFSLCRFRMKTSHLVVRRTIEIPHTEIQLVFRIYTGCWRKLNVHIFTFNGLCERVLRLACAQHSLFESNKTWQFTAHTKILSIYVRNVKKPDPPPHVFTVLL